MRDSASVVFVGVVLYPLPAMLYIDPGSGSAIISAIIGLLVALAMVIKTYWYKLKGMFSSEKSEDDKDDPNTPPQR